jgi:class 3 adenylate cyclase
MNYTVIGDAVNMASGLQRMAERGQILIDQRTADLLAADGFPTRRIGPCNLKGVTVEAYELLGPGPERKLSQGAEADK